MVDHEHFARNVLRREVQSELRLHRIKQIRRGRSDAGERLGLPFRVRRAWLCFAAYTLNMWTKLRRCFGYAEVELSNNLAENSMRPVALGRKNWLHVGSAQAGPKVAAILSVVESCRRLAVPVKEYLSAMLPGLSRRKLPEVRLLTPSRWATSRSIGELRRLSSL